MDAMTKVRPLGDRLLVRRQSAADRSEGGILLPERSQERPAKGEVLAAGPGRINDQTNLRVGMDVKVGQVVLFTNWAGNEIPGEKDLLIISSQDVLGVIEN